jgi:hypothetical protein
VYLDILRGLIDTIGDSKYMVSSSQDMLICSKDIIICQFEVYKTGVIMVQKKYWFACMWGGGVHVDPSWPTDYVDPKSDVLNMLTRLSIVT